MWRPGRGVARCSVRIARGASWSIGQTAGVTGCAGVLLMAGRIAVGLPSTEMCDELVNAQGHVNLSLMVVIGLGDRPCMAYRTDSSAC